MKQFYLLAIVATLITACDGLKAIPSEKKSYIGTWQGEYMAITITSDAKINYKYKKDTVSKTIQAPIFEFIGNDFKVSVSGLNTVFVVSKVPYFEDGVWKMVIDDQLVIRKNALYL
ncbi:hypothetical protein A9G34_09260 [Gilliamella sp. Choc4-2]|nr:hypothetical protein A9G33_05910 [Gilliamella apicola]OCG43351.1 hypothetical protein A9G34_09260 [Gilliamella apicola]OCG55140.1 hypothetical protein A9G36_06485 [Gilliamella apicola]OCG63983.1 hypothetical protein A9G48_04720 [Gilliamella apicola]